MSAPAKTDGKVVEITDAKHFDTLLKNWDRVSLQMNLQPLFSEIVLFLCMCMQVVVDFNAEWCVPCKRMTPAYAALAELHRNVLFVSIDVDKHEELVNRFPDETASIPCFLFIHKGSPQDSLTVSGASEKKLRDSAAALSKL